MAYSSVLACAKSQLGVKESPANSNNVKYNTWYYGHAVSGSGYAWCAVFITWCFAQTGISANIKGVQNKAYVPSWEAWAKKEGRWHTEPKIGALVIYDWNKDGGADHIGIIESFDVKNKTVTAIEGNTAIGNDSNGGEVMRRVRSMSYVRGYIYVTIYPPKKEEAKIYATGEGQDSGTRVYSAPTFKKPTDEIIKKGQKVNCYGTHNAENFEWWKINEAGTKWVRKTSLKNRKSV